MNKTISLIAAAAAAVTAIPAAMAVPQAANAAVRVAVGVPGGGFYYGGRHYRNRYWRNNAWVYVDPFEPAVGYGEPAYGYNYAPAPSVGVYYDGGRRYNNRARDCHYNPNRGTVCKYRYW